MVTLASAARSTASGYALAEASGIATMTIAVMSAPSVSSAHLRTGTPFSVWRATTSSPLPPGSAIFSRATSTMPLVCICSEEKSFSTLA